MFKKIITLVLCTTSCILLFAQIGAHAAYFPDIQTDSITFTESNKSNVYLAGQSVKVNTDIQKDAVLMGQTVTVTGAVERSLVALGQTITVNSKQIGSNTFIAGQTIDVNTSIDNGSLRAAGQVISLTGSYSDDVIVASDVLDLANITIKGDLIAASATINFGNNVVVEGDFYGNTTKSDIESIVQGSIYPIEESESTIEMNTREVQSNDNGFWFFSFGSLFTSLILSLLAFFVLKRGNYVNQYWQRNTITVIINWSIGLFALVAPVLALVLSFILQIYSFVIPATILLYALFSISLGFTGFYLAQILFAHKESPLRWFHLVGVIIALHILSWIPYVQIITGFVGIILIPATFGFILRALYYAITRTIMASHDTD